MTRRAAQTATERRPALERPALRYYGGKWLIAPWIIRALPPHRCYVEPFGGGASVLLRKPPSKVEVYNDVAGEVVNYFRIVRERCDDLVRVLRLTPHARDEFYACAEPAADELERARRFFVQSWQGIGGTPGTFRFTGWRRTPDRAVSLEVSQAIEDLSRVAERLRRVAIDALDWREVLTRYDRHDTLFYCDPPYVRRTRGRRWAASGYRENEISDVDHVELLDRLNSVRGRVVLSGFSTPTYELRLAGWTRLERVGHRQRGGGSLEVLWVSPERRSRR